MGARRDQDAQADEAPTSTRPPSIPTASQARRAKVRAKVNVPPPPSRMPPKVPRPPRPPSGAAPRPAARSSEATESGETSGPVARAEQPSANDVAPEAHTEPAEGDAPGRSSTRPTAAPPAREDSLIPDATEAEVIGRFARFDVLGRLATGGMADILLARQSLEGAGSRSVVIKVVRGEFAEDGEFAKMFLNEGRLAMRLSHPNICTVYECGRHEGRFYIAMEHVPGQTLRGLVVRLTRKKRRVPIPELLRIFSLVAEALHYAHRAKDSAGRPLRIVHRDVSPHNVMIRYDGIVKLLDFGVAKAERSEHSTEAGAVKGKFGYMSPEQAMGQPVDPRSDVFALGVCLFETLTGRRLFGRKTQYDTVKAILEEETPPPSTFRDDVPPGLDQIVTRALAKDPGQRYQRAEDFQHDLDHLLADMKEVVSAGRIGLLMEELFARELHAGPSLDADEDLRARLLASITSSGVAQSSEVPESPSTRRPVWMYAGVAILALALIATVFALSSFGGDDDVADLAPAPSPSPASTGPASGGGAAIGGSTAFVAPPSREAAQEEDVPSPSDDDNLADSTPSTEVETATREEPSEPEAPTTRPRDRRTPSTGRGGRRGGPVIVTDPGF
ncbi:MAG: hypothetical protein SangKO_014860 [Sandaracinaceae bacterium]